MPIPLGIVAVAGAGGAPAGAFELISSQVVSANNITTLGFFNIPQTFRHLQLRIVYQVNTSSTNIYSLSMAFNGDSSTTDNARHWLFGTGSQVASNATSNTGQISAGLVPYPQPGTFGGGINPSTLQSQFVAAIMDILDYGSTTKHKTTRFLSGYTTSGASNVTLGSALWTDTSAINSVFLFAENAPNFTVGSRFSLYGIR